MHAIRSTPLKRNDDRLILHFDYDCFYASVFEAEDPALRSLPLAVQQKQIIVTCNYEARRRGLHKLQLVSAARKACPEVIIVLGEDLTKFRNASKALYNYLREYVWSKRAERLGFDEVFLDVTDMIDYNVGLLNRHDLSNSYFQLSRTDPTRGFEFDASTFCGHMHPQLLVKPPTPPLASPSSTIATDADSLRIRLILGSHLAQHLCQGLEYECGYTATVGISTSKLVSKLVGNLNKPRGQTTLVPPYVRVSQNQPSNVVDFIDSHGIGQIPGIGFKLARKIRAHVLQRPAQFEEGLVYGGSKEHVTVRDVRCFPGMGPQLLEKALGGPGSPHGTGAKVWELLNGIDDSEVALAKKVPSQISLEDSYIRLDTLEQARKELLMLSNSLIKRLHLDLLDDEVAEEDLRSDDKINDQSPTDLPVVTHKRWLAHPKTLRLTTRPRPPLRPDGTRVRTFNRISRSGPMPNFIFNLKENKDSLADRLVNEALMPQFRKLHPEKSGWNLSLVNVAATNMIEAAGGDPGQETGVGRDIGKMFQRQESVLREWRVEDRDVPPESTHGQLTEKTEENVTAYLEPEDASLDEHAPGTYGFDWQDDQEDDQEDDMHAGDACETCGAVMPSFAMAAHRRYHDMGD
ncbi:MAG: hypothetical protein M1833_006643 [Piccolia ochrophora]|nr:MAG: hypothetical protein M1833_006643 [Piccolia ochrophora]